MTFDNASSTNFGHFHIEKSRSCINYSSNSLCWLFFICFYWCFLL